MYKCIHRITGAAEASLLTKLEPEPVYEHYITGAEASLLTILEPEPVYEH